MAKGRGGLGRGLESLFEDAAPSFESDTRIETLPLREIEPDPGQPRKTFDDETLAELSASIAEHGLLQPIAVRPKPSGGYLIVAGERRWRASRMAGLTEVPVIVKDVTDEQAMELALVENLQREGFQPFFACQSRVRDPGKREHTKHLLRLRRAGQITGQHVPEIIILNSHDGASSFQLLPGIFRSVCTNSLVCGQSFGEIRVPHRGDIVGKVIEGAYEVLSVFDRVEEKREAMQSLRLPAPAQHALANAALTYRFGEEHQPVTATQILTPRRYEDRQDDLWSVFNRCQENLLKGGLPGRTTKGKRSHTRAVKGIDGDVKLNRALWVMAEELQQVLS